MANIFKQNRDVTQHPNRNNFDLSYRSHSTFKFGYLYPVFKRKVVPGDSFRIRSAFDLKMHAIQFPVQSQIRAHMHFFYVRNKNLWEHFEDYMTGQPRNTPYVHPYIQVPDSDFKNGSIHDFLGVPTSAVTRQAIQKHFMYYGYNQFREGNFQPNQVNLFYSPTNLVGTTLSTAVTTTQGNSQYYALPFIVNSPVTQDFYLPSQSSIDSSFYRFLRSVIDKAVLSRVYYFVKDGSDYSYTSGSYFTFSEILDSNQNLIGFKLSSSDVDSLNQVISSYGSVAILISAPISDVADVFTPYLTPEYSPNIALLNGFVSAAGTYDYSQLGLDLYTNRIHLDALPYRAYESIYRAFYANDVWQPLVVNGEKEYNTFNTNRSDGADSTPYGLFKRNYELDFLTSALPSPQSGNAPLVGISALGNITVESEEGVTNAVADVDGNGNITGVSITSPLASVNHARTLMNIASLGMNINDFRNANALQKLLEQTMRSGYRYLNFTKGHYGVAPKDNVLGMPEFIGGYSRDVQVTTVVSGSDTFTGTYGKELGEYGGNGRVVGGSNHDISHFCDDHGWIIGVMCITPTPAYSQLLPKENICPRNYLDYYFPEMAQLGMQAIPYTEVCPIQAYIDYLQDNSKKLTDTFGYQRPNYDMVASVDEVHGDFRGSLKDYLINRQFDGRPELGSDFLQVNPEEINDIFINRNPYDDVFIGHLAFQVYAKRPVPRIHVPSL